MGILGKIMSSIFGSQAQAAPAGGATASAPGSSPATASTSSTTQPSAGVGQPGIAAGQPATAGAGSTATGSSGSPVAVPSAGGTVDVAEVLDQKVKAKGQTLNWRTSIVDLMKALDLDSSLAARKELADDLNYTGDTSDSATMNIWLHKQLMAKLAENGGKVPADLHA